MVRVMVSTEFFQNWLKIYAIQDFPNGRGVGGENQTVGLGQDFCQNCMKVRGEGSVGPWRPLDPPMQKGSKLQMYLVYSSCGLLRLGPSLNIIDASLYPILLPQKRTESTNLAFSI